MIYHQIKTLFDQSGLTQEEYCQSVGISRATLARLLKCDRFTASADVLDKFCRYYQIQPAHLITWKRDNAETPNSSPKRA